MGSKSKKTSLNSSNIIIRKLQKRISELEKTLFHEVLRLEASINLLINKNIMTKDEHFEETKKCLEISQQTLVDNIKENKGEIVNNND